MRRVDRARVGEPSILHKPRPSDGKSELQLVTEHMEKIAAGEKPGAFGFARYKEASVKTALEKLFHGKCAYCESFYAGLQPVDVEHYRPKGEVEGVSGHPGYWWLAMEWSNLLPSCIDCNRRRNQKTPKPGENRLVVLRADGDFDRSRSILSGKQSAFPLLEGSPHAARPDDDIEAEKRLLLDPTRDDPDQHLVFHVDREHLVSLVYPMPLDPAETTGLPEAIADHAAIAQAAMAAKVSAIGAVSIQVYGLNRLGLVQARTRVLRDLEFLLAMSLNLQEIAAELTERAAARSVELAGLQGAAKERFAEDIAMDERIADKIGRYAQEALARIREMTLPQAPYSRLARAWVEAYLAG